LAETKSLLLDMVAEAADLKRTAGGSVIPLRFLCLIMAIPVHPCHPWLKFYVHDPQRKNRSSAA
jgi:hypothetical protein